MCDDINEFSTSNFSNKSIIICATAKRALNVQQKLDLFLDKNEKIKGDSVLVVGSQD